MTEPFALVIGEVLVDLIEDHDDDGSLLYRPRFGGSPLNVAVGVRRLGVDVEFIGAFGNDVFGRRLREFLPSEGISVRGSFDAGMGTCLAVAMTEAGHVTYEYFGDFGSLTQIRSIDADLVSEASVIHAGSTAFNTEPAYSAALAAFDAATAFSTMDPNPRPFLIDDRSEYVARLERAFALVDLVKLSGDDLAYLYPRSTPEAAAGKIRDLGGATVIVTRADEDTLAVARNGVQRVAVPPIQPVDPTGAGDSFMAYLIAAIVRDGVPPSDAAWQEGVRCANAAAALACLDVGGATAMPTWSQVQERLESVDSPADGHAER